MVVKLVFFVWKCYGIDGSFVYVKCIFFSVIVSFIGVEIGYDNLCVEGIVEFGFVVGINVFDLVVLVIIKFVCVDWVIVGNNFGIDGSVLEFCVIVVFIWIKKLVRKLED